MRVVDVALKDLLRAFRSAFLVAMMLGLPLLATGLLYFAFSGLSSGESVDLPVTRVVIHDGDLGAGAGFRFGSVVASLLTAEGLADTLQTQSAPDAAAARAAVDNRQADVAVLIPATFSQAAMGLGSATVTLYQDPTLTVGPRIVQGVLSGVVDGFSGIVIARQVVAQQFQAQGLALSADEQTRLSQEFGTWATAQGTALSTGELAGLEIEAASQVSEARSDEGTLAQLLAGIMVGMMIFAAFFTGAGSAESIITEQEEGTLARLFTTPIRRDAILAGKFVGIAVTLVVQILVVMLLARLIFGVRWGAIGPAALAIVGLVVAAAGFGVFLASFYRSTRQAGPLVAIALTVTGMAGGLMTTGVPSLSSAFETVQLLTPQGWALRLWNLALDGATGPGLWLAFGGVLVYGGVLFAVGALVFRRRFA